MSEEALDLAFFALADPTRRAILARLAEGPATVAELCAPFSISQPAISKHLATLERAGLISRRRDGARRPCQIEAARLREVSVWVGAWAPLWAVEEDSLEPARQAAR